MTSQRREWRGQTTHDILGLVRVALDEFDSVPLQASVRRAVRIAVALGATQTAVRLNWELRAAGGHAPSNRADTERLLDDASAAGAWGPTGVVEKAFEAYVGDRKIANDPDGRLDGHGLDEIDFWDGAMPSLEDADDSVYRGTLAARERQATIVSIARYRTFNALCGWERQLTFAATNESILTAHQARVDAALAASAPAVLDQFNAVFRRLDDAVVAESDTAASELLAQAVTSCRRILKSVVDIAQPVDPATPKSEDGHALNDAAYKNRLFEFLKDSTQSDTMSDALTGASTALWERFGAIDTLASKGVHATVARDEAELCALNTYLMAGEILKIHERPSAASGSDDAANGVPSSADQQGTQ